MTGHELECFKLFLIQNNAFEEYKINLDKQEGIKFPDLLDRPVKVSAIIDRTLHWAGTNEGSKFWRNLNNKWATLYYKGLDSIELKGSVCRSIW